MKRSRGRPPARDHERTRPGASLPNDEGGCAGGTASAVWPIDAVAKAERILASRRRRDNYFPPDLFADPAYDILLDLFVQEGRGRRVSVSSACLAASVPSTTALRWIGWLTDRGLIVRVPDPSDGRRVHVELLPDTRERLTRWLLATAAG